MALVVERPFVEQAVRRANYWRRRLSEECERQRFYFFIFYFLFLGGVVQI